MAILPIAVEGTFALVFGLFWAVAFGSLFFGFLFYASGVGEQYARAAGRIAADPAFVLALAEAASKEVKPTFPTLFVSSVFTKHATMNSNMNRTFQQRHPGFPKSRIRHPGGGPPCHERAYQRRHCISFLGGCVSGLHEGHGRAFVHRHCGCIHPGSSCDGIFIDRYINAGT